MVWTVNPPSQGARAEQQARDYLLRHGLTLLEHNYHCRMGEIDLIMKDHDVWVFVEVRYRRSTAHGTSLETVTIHKQQKIIRTAMHYLQQHRLYDKVACRFDVVASQNANDAPQIDWVKNAFQLES